MHQAEPLTIYRVTLSKNEEFNLGNTDLTHLLSSRFCGENESSTTFDSKFPPQQYFLTSSEDTSFLCDICGKTFYVRSQLEHHILTHNRQNIFNCDECNEIFEIKSELRHHILCSHTEEKQIFCCEVCHKTFRKKINLKEHSACHSENRPFECIICSKTYKRRSALTKHLSTHKESTTFHCNDCGKEFTAKPPFKRHILNGACAGRSYNPGKVGRTKQGIQDTQNADISTTTTQKRSICCKECGSIFECKNEFWTHMLHHIDEFQSMPDVQMEAPQSSQSKQGHCEILLENTVLDEPTSLLLDTPRDEVKAEVDNKYDVACPACLKPFDQYALLIEHAKMCQKYTSLVGKEENKMISLLEEPEYCCGFCPSLFHCPTLLAKHLEETHGVNLIFHWCKKYGCDGSMNTS